MYKIDVFKAAQRVNIDLDYFCKKICHQELWNIANLVTLPDTAILLQSFICKKLNCDRHWLRERATDDVRLDEVEVSVEVLRDPLERKRETDQIFYTKTFDYKWCVYPHLSMSDCSNYELDLSTQILSQFFFNPHSHPRGC